MRGLEDIDWSKLEHAHGRASDLPGVLLGLVSADPEQRLAALDQFRRGPLHQGSRYSATLAAVPFVIQAVAAPHADRAALLQVLTHVALPGADERGCRRFDLDALLREHPFPRQGDRRDYRTDQVWLARECWAAVARGCSEYRALLAPTHAVETRSCAARLLALFPIHGRLAIADLRRIAMNEREEVALRASAFIALGHFVRIELVEGEGLLLSAATRIGGALAERDPHERKALVWPLVGDDAALESPEPWPWPSLPTLLDAQLARPDPEVLMEQWRRAQTSTALRELLDELFPDPSAASSTELPERVIPHAVVAQWSDAQRALVEDLAGREGLWPQLGATLRARLRLSFEPRPEELRAALAAQLAAAATVALLRGMRAHGSEADFLSVMQQAVCDAAASVRLAAVEAIGERPPSAPLLELLSVLCRDGDDAVRLRAVGVAGSFGPKAAPLTPVLMQAGEGREVLLALGRIASFDACAEWLKTVQHDEVVWTLRAMRPASQQALEQWLAARSEHHARWMLSEH